MILIFKNRLLSELSPLPCGGYRYREQVHSFSTARVLWGAAESAPCRAQAAADFTTG